MDINVASKEFIDAEDALRRIGGNEELYKRLLSRFIDGNYVGALDDAIEKGDVEESVRLAHTLKGVSANLSLVKIRSISTELEQMIKDGADYSAGLAELRQVYGETITKIAEVMK